MSSRFRLLIERSAVESESNIYKGVISGDALDRSPEFDNITDINATYQMVIRFNADHHEPRYNSAELPQVEYYANSGLDP